MVERKRLDEVRIAARIVASNEKSLSEGKESRFESASVSTRRGTHSGATWADRDQSGPRYRGLGCSVPCAFLGHSSRTAYHELIKKPRTFSADLVAYRTYCRVACIVHRTPCTFPARAPPTFHHLKFLEIRPIYIRLILLSQLVTTYRSLSRGQLKSFFVISSTQATICDSYRCKSAKDSGKAKLWRLCQRTIVESEDDAALELRPPRRLRQTEGPVPQPISKK